MFLDDISFQNMYTGEMKQIPEPARKRLVLLERILENYPEKNITSLKIQNLTGWSSAVVRRDISYIGVSCGATNGYRVRELHHTLRNELYDFSEEKKGCIVGLGKLGQRLLDTTELYGTPFKIVAGFDSSVNKTEVLSSSFPLHPTPLMKKIIADENIVFALLTVEREDPQETCNLLIDCGIKKIINYTSTILSVPDEVKVRNVSLLTSLYLLS